VFSNYVSEESDRGVSVLEPNPARVTSETLSHREQGSGSSGFSLVNASIPLLGAQPTWRGLRSHFGHGPSLRPPASLLCVASGSLPFTVLRSCSGFCSESLIYCNRTATGLVQAGTGQTNVCCKIAANPINKPNYRTY
jgi:hypothetical protein